MTSVRTSVRGETGRMLRLILAAVLLLASVATARLQGESAARHVLYASLGLSLCSGEQAAPDDGSSDIHDVHCAACTLPFVDVPQAAAALPQAIARGTVLAGPTVRSDTAPLSVAYQPRAPPLQG